MSYTITSLDSGRIIVLASHADFDPRTELPQSAIELIDLLDASQEKVVLLMDTREHVVHDFNQILESGAFTVSELGVKLHKHPKLVKEFVVANAKLLELMFKGLDSETFGHVKMTMFESMDEALSLARAALYGEQKAV